MVVMEDQHLNLLLLDLVEYSSIILYLRDATMHGGDLFIDS